MDMEILLKTMVPLAVPVVLVTAGCGGSGSEITEDSLSPVTEVEVADPIGQSLNRLERLYRARDAGEDSGFLSVSDSGSWEKDDDGIGFFIQRITWTVLAGRDEPTFYETIDRVVELITDHTGRPADGIRMDVAGALSEFTENMPEPYTSRYLMTRNPDPAAHSGSCTGSPGSHVASTQVDLR